MCSRNNNQEEKACTSTLFCDKLFVNNIPWYDEEDDSNDDGNLDDSSINIIIKSQEDLSVVGLFSLPSDNYSQIHCNHCCNYFNEFGNHNFIHLSKFQNLSQYEKLPFDCLNSLWYSDMEKNNTFLPRMFAIEAALKRKCDCSLHSNEIKKMNSRTESLRDIYKAKDLYASEVTETFVDEKKDYSNSQLNFLCSSTPKRKPSSESTLMYMSSDFNASLTNCKECLLSNSLSNENKYSYCMMAGNNNTSSVGVLSELACRPKYQNQKVDQLQKSYFINKSSDIITTFPGNSLGSNQNSFSPLETLSDNDFSNPVDKMFMNEQEHTNWLNDTEFPTGFIDTHCHLDFLFRKLNFSQSFDNFIHFCKETEPFPKSFKGCITVFCDPRSFFKFSWWQILLSNDKIWGAFGCHPHFTDQFGPDEENMLRYALTNEKVIATGEIGLDYSRKSGRDHEQQISVFERQLIIALEVKKPLIIHCREAFGDAFPIMKKLLPKNYTIHLHCFTGSIHEATAWMNYFPNLYFGFTSIVTQDNKRAANVKYVVQSLPLNRILLETDSPYFRPFYMEKGMYSHPGMAIHVASAIASLRQISIEVVLEETRKNTFNVYNI